MLISPLSYEGFVPNRIIYSVVNANVPPLEYIVGDRYSIVQSSYIQLRFSLPPCGPRKIILRNMKCLVENEQTKGNDGKKGRKGGE